MKLQNALRAEQAVFLSAESPNTSEHCFKECINKGMVHNERLDGPGFPHCGRYNSGEKPGSGMKVALHSVR